MFLLRLEHTCVLSAQIALQNTRGPWGAPHFFAMHLPTVGHTKGLNTDFSQHGLILFVLSLRVKWTIQNFLVKLSFLNCLFVRFIHVVACRVDLSVIWSAVMGIWVVSVSDCGGSADLHSRPCLFVTMCHRSVYTREWKCRWYLFLHLSICLCTQSHGFTLIFPILIEHNRAHFALPPLLICNSFLWQRGT